MAIYLLAHGGAAACCPLSDTGDGFLSGFPFRLGTSLNRPSVYSWCSNELEASMFCSRKFLRAAFRGKAKPPPPPAVAVINSLFFIGNGPIRKCEPGQHLGVFFVSAFHLAFFKKTTHV